MITLDELLQEIKGELASDHGAQWPDDPKNFFIHAIRSLESADGKNDLSFCVSDEYLRHIREPNPAVLVTNPKLLPKLNGLNSLIILCEDPYLALAKASWLFESKKKLVHSHKVELHQKSHFIDPKAVIHESVVLGPNVVVGAGCQIGANSVLHPGVVLQENVILGENTALFPNVVIYSNVRVGHSVRIHAGAVIGADGFGYALKKKDLKPVGHEKIWHLGAVVIGDFVEIGAGTCIDRGTFENTEIANHVKIDNLVQIGHNVQIAEGAILCGACAIAGGVKIGSYAVLTGGVGVVNRIEIGAGAQVAAYALVTRDVLPGQIVAGNPQRELKEHFKVHAYLNKAAKKKTKDSSR